MTLRGFTAPSVIIFSTRLVAPQHRPAYIVLAFGYTPPDTPRNRRSEPRPVPTWRGSPIGGTPQISMAAAATAIPVTNAATQVNSRRSSRNVGQGSLPGPYASRASKRSGPIPSVQNRSPAKNLGAFTYWEEVEDAGEQEFEVLLCNSAPFRAAGRACLGRTNQPSHGIARQ